MSLLDIILFSPLVAFFITLLLPRGNSELIRRFALLISLLIFALSLGLIPPVLSGEGFQFESDIPWIDSPSIRYHIGIDGLSLWLVLLSTFLTPVCVLISWRHIDRRVKDFFAFLMLLEFGLIGVFIALDLFLFYVFWEVCLVPMYFLIGVWGHERRIYAAVKFFLYTMAGSVLMLAAIIYLYIKTGTFDYLILTELFSSGRLALSSTEQTWLFLAFFISFAIKVPLFPLHTWLPDAHVEAPTAGSVMLASVMLKLGTYGLVRFCLPMFPSASREHASWIVALAIIGIIYGALVAMVQPNMKKLVAYSSVSHLGFVVLGIFSFNQIAIDGAVYQMLNHGISTGALFMLVGYLYERRHSLEIADYGGVATPAPWLATVFLITTLASIGLPTLNNFVGEYLVLQGASQARFVWTVFAALGVILSAVYMLWLYQRAFFGRWAGAGAAASHGHSHGDGHSPHDHANTPVPHTSTELPSRDSSMPDLNLREWVAILPMIILMVWMGVAPQTFLPSIGGANTRILELNQRSGEVQVKTRPAVSSAIPMQEVIHAR